MDKLEFLLVVSIVWSLSFVETKRRASNSSQNNLGDFCIPGTCISLNSNCKRVGGSAFRCVCKEQYISVNKTHCVRVINASMDSACAACIERHGVCLDENVDDQMDRCFCQTDSDVCHGVTTASSTATTTPVQKSGSFSVPMMTPSLTDRSRKQGELILDVYDINQQRLVENGGSVFDGDRLFVEIKYRPVQRDSDRQQIIVENCSLASSVSDSDVRLEKVPLLTNRCPSLDSRLAVRFQRIDPVHLKSTVFQVQKFDTTSVVYLRCAIAVCTGRTEHCQERLCPETRRPPALHRSSVNVPNASILSTADSAPFDYIDEDDASVIALRRRKRTDADDERDREKLAKLLSDLTLSMDPTSSKSLLDESSNRSPYEIRQVQQQFTIEVPSPPPIHKHKAAYDALYGRTSLAVQGAIERSTVIATISIVFIIGISISLFVVYRTCYIEYQQRYYGSSSVAGFGTSGESIYGNLRSTSQVCRYDMGRRSEQRFDESFFVTNVEPLGAYRRQY